MISSILVIRFFICISIPIIIHSSSYNRYYRVDGSSLFRRGLRPSYKPLFGTGRGCLGALGRLGLLSVLGLGGSPLDGAPRGESSCAGEHLYPGTPNNPN